MDFTIKTYKTLLESLIHQGYAFQTFAEFLEKPEPRSIILRHDVEAKYRNALELAIIQEKLKIKGTYYFRFLPGHFDVEIIKKISLLGHEIGYHYEDLSYCKGDYNKALRRFEKNLETLRKIAPVKTICMEGAPLSKYDNRNLWKKYNYRDYGLIGEPYFDLDFSRVLYLTDTGRRWDGEKVSVRDKVGSRQNKFQIPNSIRQLADQTNLKPQISNLKPQIPKFHSTYDIIKASHLLPDQVMFTFHPQRWTDDPLPWMKELVMQNVKNVVKRIMLNVKG